MNKVFVTQEPARKVGGRWEPTINLAPAAAWGEVRVMLRPGTSFFAREPVLAPLRDALREFGASDYLLPLGDPLIMATAAILAYERVRPARLRLLKWDRMMGEYVLREVGV